MEGGAPVLQPVAEARADRRVPRPAPRRRPTRPRLLCLPPPRQRPTHRPRRPHPAQRHTHHHPQQPRPPRRTRHPVGTPAFMAPERIRGHSASPATDVFALGNLTVFAATGRTAFGEGNPEALFFRIINERPELGGCDSELRAVVEWCLAKEPGERPSVGEVMEYAREQIQGEMMSVAGSWLPNSVATSLAGYGTAKYTKTGETRKEEGTTQKADKDKPPTGGTTPPSRQDNSVLTGLGCLAVLIFIVVVAIGPQKVFDWGKSDGKPSGSPGYAAPSYTPPADSTAGADTGTDPIEEDATDPGCKRASQAISSNRETFDEASAASLSALASSLDSAADAAEDSEVASAIRALANDNRSMSDSAAGVHSARDRGDSTQLKTYQEARSDGFDQWEKDAETCKSLCE
ncbi:hypothetical protein ACFXBB_31695 [Streptomyces scopuliridis]|uniref:protein kinase domain-containing protein n=1 Tax=Streptomyces scopuliridis TaxID=452529 RepID=UPI003678D883